MKKENGLGVNHRRKVDIYLALLFKIIYSKNQNQEINITNSTYCRFNFPYDRLQELIKYALIKGDLVRLFENLYKLQIYNESVYYNKLCKISVDEEEIILKFINKDHYDQLTSYFFDKLLKNKDNYNIDEEVCIKLVRIRDNIQKF